MMKKRKVSQSVKNIKGKIKRTIPKTKSLDKSKKNKRLKRLLNIALICVVIGVILVTAFFAYVVVKAPKFNPNNLKFKEMSIIYDADENVIGKLGDENRTEITYDKLPEVLIDAIIATEDSRFFQHNGFDLPRFIKASLGQVIGKNSGGASTLTMQIVKNNYTSKKATGFKGIIRKFTDIYLSIFKVEKKYTKKEIIEFYVNDSYLGNGAYGVEQAAQNYFGKSVSDINLSEASFIAGLFQAPGSYDPYNNPDKAEKRRQTVLYLMERHGYITTEERRISKSTPVSSLIKKEKTNNSYLEYQGYIDTVIEELKSKYNINPYVTPVKIYTGMKKSKQDFVNKVMNGEAWKWENDSVQGSVVMTDSDTGIMIAVGSGRNKNTQRSYNYATQINRQIGSTAKPLFDYGPAYEYLGWGSINYIVDEPYTYSNGKPIKNSEGGYKGILPSYQALGLSRNIPALKTFQQVSKEVGNEKIVEFVTTLGIKAEVENGRVHEAHSIGAFNGSNPKTMAGAYGAFSNGGYYIEPHTITKFIYKDSGKVVEPNFPKTKAMEDSTAFLINYALNWSATSGMSRSAANISGVDVAAKTGTTNLDADTIKKYGLRYNCLNDLWVVGYSPKNVISFWYGYDKIDSTHYSTSATWSVRDKFFKNLAQNLFDKDGSTFKKPESIISETVVKNSMPLKLASDNTPDDMKVMGYFAKGTVPKETSSNYDKLPNVSSITSKLSGNVVNLSWNGISAEQMLNLTPEDSWGSIGYDIYIKNNSTGSETLLATTTSTTYTHTSNISDATYTIYTAYKNYKNNKSSGAQHKVSIKSDFDITCTDETVNLGSNFTDTKPVIVLYNSIDVTAQSKIETISNLVTTAIPGKYKIEYKVTYNGNSKIVSRTVTVKDVPTTTTTTKATS
ncbi:MAG: transglycosylase domain-containing protein [Bacilli bacterium]